MWMIVNLQLCSADWRNLIQAAAPVQPWLGRGDSWTGSESSLRALAPRQRQPGAPGYPRAGHAQQVHQVGAALVWYPEMHSVLQPGPRGWGFHSGQLHHQLLRLPGRPARLVLRQVVQVLYHLQCQPISVVTCCCSLALPSVVFEPRYRGEIRNIVYSSSSSRQPAHQSVMAFKVR